MACASDQRGAVMPIMAAVMMITAGGAALAVDVGRAYAVKADLQAAADAAALAAAIMLPDVKEARKAAQVAADRTLPSSKPVLTNNDITFGSWNAGERALAGSGAASAVQVTVQLSESRGNALETLFAGVFGEAAIDITSSATAGKSGIFCLLALDPDGKGLEIKGKSELELTACSTQINADHKEALKVNGDSFLYSDGVCVSGGAKVSGQGSVSPQPSEYCPPHADPLASFEMPEIGACTDNDLEIAGDTISLSPGRVFCGGLKVTGSARVRLDPGLYIINDGKFEVRDDAVIEGDGVTIILYDKKSEFDIKGSASLRLTAPTEGPYKGLLITQSEGDFFKPKDNKWDSSETSELTGVVYLPDGKFTSKIEANITGTDACFVLIAKEIKLDGNARMSIDLSSTGCRGSLPTAFSRSVVLLD
ncbi:MAG: pilus assembly protein TadG-related protein [Pseudomonadota bacterium]